MSIDNSMSTIQITVSVANASPADDTAEAWVLQTDPVLRENERRAAADPPETPITDWKTYLEWTCLRAICGTDGSYITQANRAGWDADYTAATREMRIDSQNVLRGDATASPSVGTVSR